MNGWVVCVLLLSLCGSTLSFRKKWFKTKTIPASKAINEDAFLTTPELIAKYGYPVETHTVTTPDGYILEMHRIPGSPRAPTTIISKPMVIVMHGFIASSADWVIAGPGKGIGYLLADLGYDVWLGNARGNTYSKKHIRYSTASRKYWNFSWHEMGIYDLPTMIDYGLKQSGQTSTFYIAHSQGCTAFYVMCAMLPEYNAKIRAMFSMAPIAYINSATSAFLILVAKFEGEVDLLRALIGDGEFLPSTSLLSITADLFCNPNEPTQLICSNSLFVFSGSDDAQLNKTLVPAIIAHLPAGSSSKQLVHYVQLYNSARFQQFHYGYFKNLISYRSFFAPNYDISKITAPVSLHYGMNDPLSNRTDVQRLFNELPNPIGIYAVPFDQWNHLDFLWAINADVLVYSQIFSLMRNY